MKLAIVSSTVLSTALLLAGCTTMPEPSRDFQASANSLKTERNFRARRLETAPPSPPVVEGSPLIIRDVVFSDSVLGSNRVDRDKLDLVANVLARNTCGELSKLFEVSETPDAENAYSLRIRITELTPTSVASAAIGRATGFVSPLGGVRPPFGLGRLTTEFELFRPDGTLAAAMVWSKQADVMSADSRMSAVGDAYESASGASSEFATLVQNQTGTQRAGNALRSMIPFGGGGDPDKACERYGKEEGLVGGLVGGYLGLPPRAAETPPPGPSQTPPRQ
jgi:predicted small secreted protein